MKKHFVTFAAAAAMASPLAIMADANAGPEVYGRVHISLDNEGYDNDNGDSGALQMHEHSSRLGFRGSESLDGGMEAFYQLEAGVAWHDNGNIAASRDSFVGLRGDFGSVRLGRLPWGNAIVYGPGNFFPTQAGDPGNLIDAIVFGGFDGAGDPVMGIGGRAKKAIEYTAPVPGPVGVIVTYVPSVQGDEDEGFDSDYMVRVTFNEGPIAVQATYMSIHHDHARSVNDGGDAGDSATVTALQGTYNLGDIRVGGGYAAASNDLDDADNTAMWLGAAMKVSPQGTIKLQYTAFNGDFDDTDVSVMALGYDHALSRRTTVYGVVANVSNDDDAGAVPHDYAGGSTTKIGEGEDGSVVSFGVIHDF